MRQRADDCYYPTYVMTITFNYGAFEGNSELQGTSPVLKRWALPGFR